MLSEEFIVSKGWKKSTYINGYVDYIHRRYNIENDDFFIELKTAPDGYCKIIEEDMFDKTSVFIGYLKSNEDLETIMRLLEYDF